jgi:IclR family KDG regulon transcriptional repressor
MHRAKSEYAIQTVTNALRLLEIFEGEEEIGVTELARRLHLHKNNVFRLLATLEDKGWVEQSADSERYRLGTACLRLVQGHARSQGLTRRARPTLEALVRETGETAHLGVLRSFEVVHLDGERSPGLVKGGLRIGERMPAHCTALGKVLLACGPAGTLEAWDRQVASEGLPAYTAETIVDRDKLIEHLRRVAAQGWAVDLEESSPGLVCAAAPVVDAAGRTVAALSVSGPVFRLDRDRVESRMVPTVVAAAAALSRELGASI